MKKNSKGVVRFNIQDPADMKVLVASGLIWRGGPNTVRAAIEYLQGHPDEVNDKVPANIRAILQPEPNQVTVPGQPEPESPVEDAGEPGEEPNAPTP